MAKINEGLGIKSSYYGWSVVQGHSSSSFSGCG